MNPHTEGDRINIGADVIGSEDTKLGSISYVIVRPPQLHVTDIVVSTGSLLGRDIVVPANKIDHVAGGNVYIDLEKDSLAQLKDYVEIQYQQPPATWTPSPGFIYPSQSVLWPTGAYYANESSVTVNAPPGTVGLHEGMDVESSDGHRLGSIKSIEEDPGSGDVIAIIIKEGLLFTHDARIPANLVSDTREGQVTLSVSKEEAESAQQPVKE